MNWVDLGVLAVIGVSALLGLSRGVVRELLGLFSWALAGYGAFRFGPAVMPLTRQVTGDADFADPAAYVITFVVLLIVFSLVANLIGRLVQLSMLGGLDRTLGLLFGIARGCLVLCVAYIPVALLLPPEKWPPLLLQARSLPLVYQGAAWTAGQIPPQYRPRVAPPPGDAPASEDQLLHATPEGRALGPAFVHTN
jgi:membrane protein required for colicin V production